MNASFVKLLAPVAVIGTIAIAGAANATPLHRHQPPVPAYKRIAHQEGRIAQGIRSGQLTPRETGLLERRDVRIDHRVAADRADNGGFLTQRERFQVRHELNSTSREIYRFKHNRARV